MICKFIAHRGNLDDRKEQFENHPDYIAEAIVKGFDAEVDIWHKDGNFYSGHDKPTYKISKNFLYEYTSYLWCHAKNIDALYELTKNNILNCFYHNVDDFTLTSKNHIWTYPNKPVTLNSVLVLKENEDLNVENISCYGICSDNIRPLKLKYLS